MRPDIFTAVAGLSVPARARGAQAPMDTLWQLEYQDFYWFYFQQPGVAEGEFERDPAETMHLLMASGGRKGGLMVPAGTGFLDGFEAAQTLPAWLARADMDALVSVYRRTGFRGGLNWYRNLDRNWELTALFAGATIRQPALFIAGTLDGVICDPLGQAALEAMPDVAPGLQRQVLIEGAGHWINEQCPDDVNSELIRLCNEWAG